MLATDDTPVPHVSQLGGSGYTTDLLAAASDDKHGSLRRQSFSPHGERPTLAGPTKPVEPTSNPVDVSFPVLAFRPPRVYVEKPRPGGVGAAAFFAFLRAFFFLAFFRGGAGATRAERLFAFFAVRVVIFFAAISLTS